MQFHLSERVDEDLRDGAGIIFVPRFLDSADAAELYDRLLSTLDFQQGFVKIRGNEIPQPRLTSWYADPGCAYTYSGATYEPNGWSQELSELREVLESQFQGTFKIALFPGLVDANHNLWKNSSGCSHTPFCSHEQTGQEILLAAGEHCDIGTGNGDFVHEVHEIHHTAARVFHANDRLIPAQPLDHVIIQG